MNNIVQFERRTPAPIQNTPLAPDYLEFLLSAYSVAQLIEIILPSLMPEEEKDSETVAFYLRQAAIVRIYADSYPEFQAIKNPR